MQWVETVFYVYMGLSGYLAMGFFVMVVIEARAEAALERLTHGRPVNNLMFLLAWPLGVLSLAVLDAWTRMQRVPKWD